MQPTVAILCDPLLDAYGPGRVAILVARHLRRSYDVRLAAPVISERVFQEIAKAGLQGLSLGEKFLAKSSSLVFLEAWLREVCFARNSTLWDELDFRPDITVNISNSIVAESDIWYMLGPVSHAVKEITPNLPLELQLVARGSRRIIEALDAKQIQHAADLSSLHVACSTSSGVSYRNSGVRVDDIIHPPLDVAVFRPSAERPEESYCLAYLGKETECDLLLRVADAGIRLTAFGSKFGGLPPRIRSHPRIHLAGFVSEGELVDLYSNAKFTLFPFASEPFGYVPVESMACGTPVLTYRKQGPAETVVDGKTGWLLSDARELVKRALDIWEAGPISQEMRDACRTRGLEFSDRVVGERWTRLLKSLHKGDGPASEGLDPVIRRESPVGESE